MESEKPTQLQVDNVIHFGASTRTYTLREKPMLPSAVLHSALVKDEQSTEENEDGDQNSKVGFLGLPELDTDLKVFRAELCG